MGKNESSKPDENSAAESAVESSAKKSKKHIVATCNNCKGVTSPVYQVNTKSEAMDLCLHKDGCPGGHDDRKFDFS